MTPPIAPETAAVLRPQRGRLWRIVRNGLGLIVLSCFTALVFVIALAATMPASALRRIIDLPAQITALHGTVWHGSATLTDGYALRWDSDFSTLILARISADVTLSGADTQLTGRVSASPWTMALRDLTGRAGPGLLALAPGLPVDSCTSRAIITGVGASFGRGQATAGGQIEIAPGECRDFGGNAIAVPALTIALHSVGNDAVADLTDGQAALAQLTVAGDRRLIIRVEPAGAARVPGLPSSGPIILEYPF